MVIEYNETQYIEEFIDSESEVPGNRVVDFYSSTCGPCKMFSKIFEEASKKHPDIKFISICVDDAELLIGKYRLRSMPTVLRVDGDSVSTHPSIHTAEELELILTRK